MKSIRKIIITALLFIFVITLSDLPAVSNPVVTQAATTIKISKKTLSLEIGKTATLKITGTKKTVKWSSSDKKIASVSSKGKVSAIAAGKAKITAAVDGKKLTCTVTVKEPANPYLKNAPFEVQEMKILNFDFVMPAEWTLNYDSMTDTGIMATLTPNDTSLISNISISIGTLDYTPAYSEIQAAAAVYTTEYLNTTWAAYLGSEPFEIADFSQKDLKATNGKVYKTQYSLTSKDLSLTQSIYDFNVGNYVLEISSNDFDGLGLADITEYVINSLIIK